MKKEVKIKEGTNLNDMIAAYNKMVEPIQLDEPTLMFNPKIYDDLPSPLKGLNKLIKKPSQCDMVLMAILTILSGILKKFKVIYRGKEEGPQLYTYVLANPGQGKGIAATIKKVGMQYHKSFQEKYEYELQEYKIKFAEFKKNPEDFEEPIKPTRKFLFCPGNTTKAALTAFLMGNGGYGLFYETETDTLFSANSGEFGGFGDMLRMGYHGESFSADRKGFEDGPMEIDGLFLSLFLTSTLNQCFKLIPTSEDGLFSRFLYIFLPTTNEFENAFENEGVNEFNVMMDELEKLFFKMGSINNADDNVMFKFTEEQAKEHTLIFQKLNKDVNIETLSGTKMRFGLIFTRICMLFSFLREWEITEGKIGNTIQCKDVDFEITHSIMEKLFHHTLILDNYYETKNVRQKSLVFISKSIGEEANNKHSSEVKEDAIKLLQKGVGYRAVAKNILGNEKLCGTIFKWNKKYKEGSFLVSGNGNAFRKCVDVADMLKCSYVSVFENVYKPLAMDNEGLDLFLLVTSNGCKGEVKKIRRTLNAERRKELKHNLYAYTPSGIFAGRRSKDTLKKHSGFMCIDIDEKDNEGISNFHDLTEEFAKITNVAFCGHSVSGKGYYLLIPIDTTNNHEAYFEGLVKAFKELGIEIDKACKDVSRLRTISYDEAHYLAHTAEVVNEVLNEPKAAPKLVKFDKPKQNNILTQILEIIDEDGTDITDSYSDWVAIGYALANEFGEHGEENFHRLSKYYPKYTRVESSKQFKECLKSNLRLGKKYNLGTIFRIAKEQIIF